MKLQRILLIALAAIISLTTIAGTVHAQDVRDGKLYQQMSPDERKAFVAEQARGIARRMSGTEYEFTQAFEAEIQRFVDKYARRIGSGAGDRLWKGELRFVFERGQAQAPVLMSAFKAHNISPLIGLYIPLVESEYVNLQTPNSVGAIGMFQFLPKTGARYGLNEQELLDVEKSAAASTRLDQMFQNENVHYVPSFFAAAIIGENPQAFGLQQQPLSSYEAKR